MEEKPLKSVYFHFRFKFLAITAISFLIYCLLSGSEGLKDFADSPQFKLMGPFFIMAGISFLVFRRFPIKCPHCSKLVATKKNWECPYCQQVQGKERYLIDKCVHCKQLLANSACEHCTQEFRL